ncbi:Glycine/D-amino acid oxidase-like deaminating enzyme OS=Castellaniella defragrans OX=75697 GN=HNR28_001859 PE=4 SV=1 [Castellaniella defragrans]
MVIDPSGAYFRPEGSGFIMGIAPPDNQDPDATDFDVQFPLFDEVLWPTLAARVPAFEALRCGRSWAGHYNLNLFDQNLILGLHPALDNLYFANGLSGHGMQQSPAIGRALSELITTGRFQTLDLTRLGWRRVLDDSPIIEKNVV